MLLVSQPTLLFGNLLYDHIFKLSDELINHGFVYIKNNIQELRVYLALALTIPISL